MKKSKLIAGAMGMMMLGAMVLPVHADEMEVKYQQQSTWIVSIPQTTLSQTQEVEQTVSATAMNIRPDEKLQVKIKGLTEGKVTLTRDDSKATTTSTVSTTSNSVNPITVDTVIAEFEDQSTDFVNGTTGKLYFSAIPEETKAGDYSGTITYVMETVKK
ncbi:MAG TPA: hypothetical protein IAB98_00115 [Candidatus Egerieimonas intestinavium]|uniref:Uncharacterized protein n=1 Tax=Candidatus Egerieimonas intestinavium TaxID=2840777 RepID=A0A9D1JEF5_9FIRM|nr:hypothetical protein [Candidatus Egerieimonas intestinavium]